MTSTSNLPLPADPLLEMRRQRLERLIQAAIHDFKLRLDFGKQDLIGERHIILTNEDFGNVSASYQRIKGKALHLFGHYLSDSRAWIEAARREESQGKYFFANLWHALEDARIENWMIRRWPGTLKSFESNLLPNLGGALISRMPINQQVETGIYLEGRGFHGARYRTEVRLALDEILEVIMEGAEGLTPNDSYQAMLAIYPMIESLLNREHGNQKIQVSGTQPEDENSSTQLDQNQNKRLDETPIENGIPEIETTDEIYSISPMERRREFPEWFKPGSAPWFERGLGNKQIHPSAVRPDRDTIVIPPEGSLQTYRTLHSEIQREAGYLAHRLTNLIREEAYLRYGGRYRSGKLNMAKLWKQRIGDYSLFQRSTSTGSRAAAFTLLIDESASMKGQDKYKMAMKAAILLGETLSFLDVPLEIIGFSTIDYEARAALKLGLTPAYEYRTTRCSPLEHRLYKRFDEPYYSARTRLTGIQPRKNNWDEEHLWFAFHRLQERPEKSKMIIIISDGQPNGDADNCIDTVQKIESFCCKVIGIGIGADYVKQIYSQAVVVSNFRQMAEELLTIIGREFRI